MPTLGVASRHRIGNGKQYEYLKDDLPPFDQGLSALVEDFYARGLGKSDLYF